jgi:hypothetical protein
MEGSDHLFLMSTTTQIRLYYQYDIEIIVTRKCAQRTQIWQRPRDLRQIAASEAEASQRPVNRISAAALIRPTVEIRDFSLLPSTLGRTRDQALLHESFEWAFCFAR